MTQSSDTETAGKTEPAGVSSRPPAVAGQFYPGSEEELRQTLGTLMARADQRTGRETGEAPAPKAVIVPHAGFVFSGAVAARAYARLRPVADKIKRVVLLGPAHRVFVPGMAVPSVEAFETPMGKIPLDRVLLDELAGREEIEISDAAHAEEHSLEVQLPFLQEILGDFTLVPVVVGGARGEAVAALLRDLWGGEETLIVISSDLSHFHPYGEAQQRDSRTSRNIMSLNAGVLGPEDACGCRPVDGLLRVARELALVPTTLDLRNSGDTAGNRTRVVGYGAWTFTEQPDETGRHLSAANKKKLLQLAGHGVKAAADGRVAPAVNMQAFGPALRRPGASFVTLTRNGRLRGCIGSLRAFQPLALDVIERGYAAARNDKRFKPVTWEELPDLTIEVAVLSAPREIRFRGEEDLLDQLRPGEDGLLLQDGGRQGTFLPKVWESLPDKKQFLAQLKRKAGFDEDYWSDTLKIWRYTTERFSSKITDIPVRE